MSQKINTNITVIVVVAILSITAVIIVYLFTTKDYNSVTNSAKNTMVDNNSNFSNQNTGSQPVGLQDFSVPTVSVIRKDGEESIDVVCEYSVELGCELWGIEKKDSHSLLIKKHSDGFVEESGTNYSSMVRWKILIEDLAGYSGIQGIAVDRDGVPIEKSVPYSL